MSKLYITEHKLQILNNVPIPCVPPLRSQIIPISSTAASSNPFSPATEFVRLESDTACSIEFGGAVATLSSARLEANAKEYFAVFPGDRVSVIQNTGGVGGIGNISGRTILTSLTDFYVAVTGNNANSGLLPTDAWATTQHAMDYLANFYDIGSQTVNVNIGAGTLDGFTVRSTVGAGLIKFKGSGIASTTLTRDPLNTFSGCVTAFLSCSSVIEIEALTLDATLAGGTFLGINNQGACAINVSQGSGVGGVGVAFNIPNFSFGLFVGSALSSITLQGGNNIFNFAPSPASLYAASQGGQIYDGSQSVTITGNPSWTSACISAQDNSVIQPRIAISGTATGRRFNSIGGSVIDSGGQDETAIPGSTPGSVASGGVFL